VLLLVKDVVSKPQEDDHERENNQTTRVSVEITVDLTGFVGRGWRWNHVRVDVSIVLLGFLSQNFSVDQVHKVKQTRPELRVEQGEVLLSKLDDLWLVSVSPVDVSKLRVTAGVVVHRVFPLLTPFS
jgi:hypothetical protein